MAQTDIKAAFKGFLPFIESPRLWAVAGPLHSPFSDEWLGKLPPEWRARYGADRQRTDARIVYTVVSYETPIAWVLLDGRNQPLGVVIPRVTYSSKTTEGQRLCKDHLPFPKYRTFVL